MIVYRVSNAVMPDNTSITIDATGFTHVYARNITQPDPDGNPVETTQNEYNARTEFTDLQAQPDFSDFAVFLRCFDPATQRVRNLGYGMNRLVNVLMQTLPTRQSFEDFLFQNRLAIMLGVVIPFADSTPDQWALVVPKQTASTILYGLTYQPTGNLTINGASSILDVASYDEVQGETLPRLAFDPAGPVVAGTVYTFTVNVTTADGEPATANQPTIYFESTAGMQLLTRSVATNGKAICIIDLNGVPTGTEVKVKAGFKYYSGLTDTTITV